MLEKHYYESDLQMGNCHYDLTQVKSALLGYLQKKTKLVFQYHSPVGHNLWGFHQNGISIHLQTTKLNEDELHFVDVKLVSEVTPTRDLEDRLKLLVNPFKKEYRT